MVDEDTVVLKQQRGEPMSSATNCLARRLERREMMQRLRRSMKGTLTCTMLLIQLLLLQQLTSCCAAFAFSPNQQRAAALRPKKPSSKAAARTTLSMAVTTTTASSTAKLSRNQQALREAAGEKFPRTWVPLASTFELDGTRPNAVHFLGQEYIVYQQQNAISAAWIVTDSVCPHRLAPLSEGRIDPVTHTLECAYHGWVFDGAGRCVKIPQADAATAAAAMANPACHLQTYSVMVEKNILWAWLWPEDSLQFMCTTENATTTPEHFLRGVLRNCSTFTRDLPYAWDTLLENIVDPSHVPHAHHGLQGKRTDAIPINMTRPAVVTQTGFNFSFADRTMGMRRQGTGEFRAPFVIQYAAAYEESSSSSSANKKTKKGSPPPTFNLTAVMIPTKPGWSRIMLFGSQQQVVKSDDAEGSRRKTSLTSKIFRLVPIWLIHQLSNRFLDSDLVFLHSHERERERRISSGATTYGYFLPAPADRCVVALRKWVDDYAAENYVHGHRFLLPALETNRKVLFDRWTQHADQCKHCSGAADAVVKWRNRTYWALAACILLIRRFMLARIGAVGCLFLLRAYNWVDSILRDGEFKHYKNH